MARAKAPAKGGLSAAHKARMADGRRAAAAVGLYLSTEPPAATRADLARVRAKIDHRRTLLAGGTLEPLARLRVWQELDDAKGELRATEAALRGYDKVVAGFVRWAAWYGDAHGITYKSWRAHGVPAPLLHRAGVRR